MVLSNVDLLNIGVPLHTSSGRRPSSYVVSDEEWPSLKAGSHEVECASSQYRECWEGRSSIKALPSKETPLCRSCCHADTAMSSATIPQYNTICMYIYTYTRLLPQRNCTQVHWYPPLSLHWRSSRVSCSQFYI